MLNLFLAASILPYGLAPIQAAQVRISPIGDSITEGYDAWTYRYFLWHLLKDGGYDVDFVGTRYGCAGGSKPKNPDFDQNHEGRYGWRIDQVDTGLYDPQWKVRNDGLKQALEHFSMDIGLIFLGHNDIFQDQGADDALKDMTQLIKLLREHNPDIAIFLALPFTGGSRKSGIQSLVRRYPGLAAQLHTARSPIIPVDFWHTQAGDHTLDTTHPDKTGDEIMAQAWFVQLSAYLSGKNLYPGVGIEYPRNIIDEDPDDWNTPNPTIFKTGSDLTLQAAAYDPDGTIAKVEFLLNDAVVGTVTKAPFNYTIQGVKQGEYALVIKATDNAGATATSAGIDYSVAASGIVAPAAPTGTTLLNPEIPVSHPGAHSLELAKDGSQLVIRHPKLPGQGFDLHGKRISRSLLAR